MGLFRNLYMLTKDIYEQRTETRFIQMLRRNKGNELYWEKILEVVAQAHSWNFIRDQCLFTGQERGFDMASECEQKFLGLFTRIIREVGIDEKELIRRIDKEFGIYNDGKKTKTTKKVKKAKTKRKTGPKRKYVCVKLENSSYFHRQSCELLKDIDEENLIGFDSTSEPMSLGFNRCDKCKPSETKAELAEVNKCVISTNGKYFHLPDCGLVKKISKENLIGFRTTNEPKSLGFKRCSRCNP